MKKSPQRVTGGGCRAQGEPRDFGGLGPASPEGSEVAQGEPRDFGGLGPASPEGSKVERPALAPPDVT